MEIHRLTPDGLQVPSSAICAYHTHASCFSFALKCLQHVALQGVADVPLYGRIATLELFRPPVSPAAGCAKHRLLQHVE